MLWSKVTWPVYQLREHKRTWVEMRVTFIETLFGTFVLDNKNLSGKTLGMRRIQLAKVLDKRELYKLKTIYYNISEIVNAKHKVKVYIDSAGEIITRQKQKYVPLLFRKVENIEVIDNKLLCTCKGIHRPILVPYMPRIMPKYLGLLVVKGDYLIYELTQELRKDTRRKV